MEISRGSFLGVIGLSGCGKSTFVRALAGVRSPESGGILLAGNDVQVLQDEFPLAVSYMSQFGTFHGELTVQEILQDAVHLRLPASIPAAVRDEWLKRIVELSRIERLLSQQYHTLSGGQMRRVALAEALIGDPAFLFLDELTSGLDAYSDQEMMLWLRDLAHRQGKTVVLVTHATYHLELCDAILFLHKGKQVFYGGYGELLAKHQVNSITELFELYETKEIEIASPAALENLDRVEPQAIQTEKPPSSWAQFPTLLGRQLRLLLRDRGQLMLHLALMLTFPALVAVFAYKGLPQVRQLTLTVESNIVKTLAEQLLYMKESFHSASLVSGLAMFQVVLLTLIGANNGAREIAKERAVLAKERRSGLSSGAYVLSKFLQILGLSAVQGFWMAWFVKTVCGFPGDLPRQGLILFATTLAMSATCLAISSASRTAERASLLAIYLVGFQLPLSGAALSLPDWLSVICRPFIAAYWGWSGYLKTFTDTRHYDIVRQSTETFISPYWICMLVLGLHVILSLGTAWYFVNRTRNE